MAIAISADREVVDQMLFGPPSPQLQQYIQQTNNYFMGMMTDIGRQFIDHAKNVFARTDTHDATALARAALRMANTHFQQDVIYQMRTIEELQEAPNSMLPWIMAHPELRRLHHDGRVDGYSGRYIDAYPTQLYGWEHPMYQTIYGGWIQPEVTVITDEEGNETEEWYDVTVDVLEDEDSHEVPLLLDEEAIYVMQAHALIDKALEEKRDPTSYYDNEIV